MLSLNLSLHTMLPFGSCISLFYQSKIKTTKVHILTNSLWLNQNCYFLLEPFVFAPPRLNPTVIGSSVPITVCWLPCCRTQGRLRLGPHLTQDPRGCFPAPRPQGTTSTAVLLLGTCQVGLRPTTATPKGTSLSKPHSWRQNQRWCQWQAWNHIPSRGMDLEFPGVSGKWIYFKPSQGRRALPDLCAQVLLVVSGCSDYQNLQQFTIFPAPIHRLRWAKRPMESACLQQLNPNEGILHLLHQ